MLVEVRGASSIGKGHPELLNLENTSAKGGGWRAWAGTRHNAKAMVWASCHSHFPAGNTTALLPLQV